MLRVLVTGSRIVTDKARVYNALYDLVEEKSLKSKPDQYGNWLPTGLIIVHGGAKGADRIASDWATVNWVPEEIHEPDWNTLGRYAGLKRNKDMLETGVDIVLAFPEGSARGTKHMIKIAQEAGVEVRIFDATTRPRI